jgi:hypothetical protein
MTLVNRTNQDFEFTFDGVGYCVPGSDSLELTEDAAMHGYIKSMMNYNLQNGQVQHQVGIEGRHDTSFIGDGKSDSDELIDRESDLEGKSQVINVRGSLADSASREDALAN